MQPGTTTYISNEQVLDKLTSEGYNIHDLYSQSTLNQLYNEDLLRSGSNWDHIDGDTRTVGISSELFNFKKDITIEALSEVIGAVTGEAPAAWMVSSIVEGGTDIHRGIWIHYERIEIHRNNGFVMTEWKATTWGYQ